MNFERAIRSSAASSMARTAAAWAAVRSTSSIVAVKGSPFGTAPFLQFYRVVLGLDNRGIRDGAQDRGFNATWVDGNSLDSNVVAVGAGDAGVAPTGAGFA